MRQYWVKVVRERVMNKQAHLKRRRGVRGYRPEPALPRSLTWTPSWNQCQVLQGKRWSRTHSVTLIVFRSVMLVWGLWLSNFFLMLLGQKACAKLHEYCKRTVNTHVVLSNHNTDLLSNQHKLHAEAWNRLINKPPINLLNKFRS